jgi:hypothetical protein
MSGTDIIRACRDESVVHSLETKVALVDKITIRIEFNRIVGTLIYTKAASGAFFLIQNDNAVLSIHDSSFRANLNTGRFATVLAKIDMEHKLRSSVYYSRAFFQNLDKPEAVWHMVFLFAGHLAGSTPPAGFVINDQFICIHMLCLL